MSLKDNESVDRVVDILSIVLISVATILSAWCGYQSARWSGVQVRNYQSAMSFKFSASAADSRENALLSIDVLLFTEYLRAKTAGQRDFADFLYRRFRPETQGAIDAWLAEQPLTNPKAARTPFAMPQYRSSAATEVAAFDRQSSASLQNARDATSTSERYVLFTVFMASISFIAGVGSRLRFPVHLIVVAVGTVMCISALVLLLAQPRA